jgi:hypothetical protein
MPSLFPVKFWFTVTFLWKVSHSECLVCVRILLTSWAAAVGIGFTFLYKPRVTRKLPLDDFRAPAPPAWLRPEKAPLLGPVFLGLLPTAFSIVVIICCPIEKPERVYLYVNVAVFGAAGLYWLGIRYNVLRKIGIDLVFQRHGVDDVNDVGHSESSQELRACQKCDGSGLPHRHEKDGYLYYLRRRPIGDARAETAALGGLELQTQAGAH